LKNRERKVEREKEKGKKVEGNIEGEKGREEMIKMEK
jgi:hypothetical protein